MIVVPPDLELRETFEIITARQQALPNADSKSHELIVVAVDNDDQIKGVFCPRTVTNFIRPDEPFNIDDILNNISTVDLNSIRPEVYWCSGGPTGGHPTLEPPPCEEHST
ncbi:MAG: hypothetical protein HUJ31_11940 [Pseudomonadales bacterium]|nr:hypothetical protein [Pseudomonadales bacterium]